MRLARAIVFIFKPPYSPLTPLDSASLPPYNAMAGHDLPPGTWQPNPLKRWTQLFLAFAVLLIVFKMLLK